MFKWTTSLPRGLHVVLHLMSDSTIGHFFQKKSADLQSKVFDYMYSFCYTCCSLLPFSIFFNRVVWTQFNLPHISLTVFLNRLLNHNYVPPFFRSITVCFPSIIVVQFKSWALLISRNFGEDETRDMKLDSEKRVFPQVKIIKISVKMKHITIVGMRKNYSRLEHRYFERHRECIN